MDIILGIKHPGEPTYVANTMAVTEPYAWRNTAYIFLMSGVTVDPPDTLEGVLVHEMLHVLTMHLTTCIEEVLHRNQEAILAMHCLLEPTIDRLTEVLVSRG